MLSLCPFNMVNCSDVNMLFCNSGPSTPTPIQRRTRTCFPECVSLSVRQKFARKKAQADGSTIAYSKVISLTNACKIHVPCATLGHRGPCSTSRFHFVQISRNIAAANDLAKTTLRIRRIFAAWAWSRAKRGFLKKQVNPFEDNQGKHENVLSLLST